MNVPTTTPKSVPAVTGYASDTTLYATKYQQGGRTVFGLDLSLNQIADLIDRPDPEKLTPGNRAIRLQHAIDFGRYIRQHEGWVSPAMILRSPSIFKFEPFTEVAGAQFGVLTFPVKKASDIHILDGQHRILGIHLAQAAIADDIDKARSELATARRVDPKGRAVADAKKKIAELEKQQERLGDERISVQVMVEEDPQAYKQAFFDIADNALGITASVKSMFDSRKVVNRSIEQVIQHPLLNGRVDLQRDRVGKNNPNFIGAKHVAEIVKTTNVGIDGRISRRMEHELHESGVAANALQFLDIAVASFPPFQQMVDGLITPEGLRKSSLLGSVLMLRVIADVYHELAGTDRAWEPEQVGAFFKKLAPHMGAPIYEESIWTEHTKLFDDGAMAPHGRRQDLAELSDILLSWALDTPKWLLEPPAPRPVSTEAEMQRVDEIIAS
jgi:hypothetical protein